MANYPERKCRICGKLFKPNSPRQTICKDIHYKPCPVCGKLVEAPYPSDPPRTCSTECTKSLRAKTSLERHGVEDAANTEEAKEKRRATSLQRYGTTDAGNTEEARKKREQTCLSRYGVKYPASVPEVKEKQKQTLLKHYGVDNPMKSEEVREKVKQTNLQKYGCENPSQSSLVLQKTQQTNLRRYRNKWSIASDNNRTKARQTMLQKYGVDNPGRSEEIREKIRNTTFERYGFYYPAQIPSVKEKFQKMWSERYSDHDSDEYKEMIYKRKQTNLQRYGVEAAFLTEESKQKSRESIIHNKKYHISKINLIFASMLDELGIQYEFEYPLKNKWYDFVLPELNILVEIDPTYTHSLQPSVYYPEGIDMKYHRNKTQLAESFGYRCVHIFDWEDPMKIASLFLPRKKVYARNCKVAYIDVETADNFLEEYHLQGTLKLQEVCLGLVYEDQLVSVMTFGYARYAKDFQWELLRYATATGIQVLGGSQKLFAHFLHQFSPESIISYCDKSKFTGGTYINLGMKLDRISEPSIIWSKDSKYIRDSLLRQRGYDQIFNTSYGKGSSNEQLMIDHGWRSVPDCGQARYIWRQ